MNFAKILRLLFCVGSLVQAQQEKLFVAVVPSYNNEQWVERNIESILTQDYSNFHVVYVDDCSTDATLDCLNAVVEKLSAKEKITIIHNETRRGAMANFYNTIHLCPDNAIIVNVDGDDWLADDQVFKYLNNVYSDENIWMTFGQFLFYQHDTPGFCQPFPDNIIRTNQFRKTPEKLPISHLRTYYAWVFKQIKLKDCLYSGDFYSMTCDKAIMAPIVEMCGFRHKCIEKVLYIYNEFNPINDHRIDMSLQHFLCDYILDQKPYSPLEKPVMTGDRLASLTYLIISLTEEDSDLSKWIDYLKNKDTKYVVVIDNKFKAEGKVLRHYIDILEKTGAFVLQIGNNENLIKTKTKLLNLSFGCIAWQIKMADGCAKFPLNSKKFIMKKDDLVRLLESEGRNINQYVCEDQDAVCLGF